MIDLRRALRSDAGRAIPPPVAGAVDGPLAHVAAGSRVVVTGILGDERLRGRLLGLGIVPGASISVAGGGPGRGRVLGLDGCRMAIDDRTAALVLVRRSTTEPTEPTGPEGSDA